MARKGDWGKDPWSKDDGGLPPEIEKILHKIEKKIGPAAGRKRNK